MNRKIGVWKASGQDFSGARLLCIPPKRGLQLSFCLLLVLGCLFNKASAQSPPTAPVLIDQVEYYFSDSTELPPSGARWQPSPLPFSSRLDQEEAFANETLPRQTWFRFYLDNPGPLQHLSLYLWRLNLHARVFFNGNEIAASTHQPGLHTMSWNHPLLAPIQPDSWQPGRNEVVIALTRTAWGGNLAPVLYGPSDQLFALWEDRMFRQVEINEVLLAFGLTLAVVTFFLWLLRRDDTVYLWFSGIALGWSVLTSHLVIYYNPVPYTYWLPLVHASIDFCTFCMYGFIGRLVDVKRKNRERLFLLWMLTAATSYFLVSPLYFWYVAYIAHLISILALAAIVVRVCILAIRSRQREPVLVAAAMTVQIFLFVQNAMLMFFGDVAQWESGMFYAHFGIPVLLLLFSGMLLMRYTRALAVAENLNRTLEQKVEASRQIIERSFAERRALELQQAAEQERLKIYRDLHDDVGSQLLSIIHADRESRLGGLARNALESLRQAVSRANTPDQPLPCFLHDIREESELRLQGSGHEVHWQQPEKVSDVIIPSLQAFNLNRILKELVSNIIRHAGASLVTFTISQRNGILCLSVSDNGHGFESSVAPGNGLRNMNQRASEIGATLQLQSSDQGTRTDLCLRLEASEETGGSSPCEADLHTELNPEYMGH